MIPGGPVTMPQFLVNLLNLNELKMKKSKDKLTCIFFIVTSLLVIFSCDTFQEAPNLIPEEPCTAPNYWCTWYWQNYKILEGQPVTNPDPVIVYSNKAARENVNENTLFGENGMAEVMLPKTRGDYYFLIDHGWQDKSIKKNRFFSFIMDPLDFPSYANLEPKERIEQLNERIKALGWKGLGLWVRGTISQEEARKFVEWSKYAGIVYWKIDGGEIENFYCYKAKQEFYPELTLEYVTGSGGPLNRNWAQEGLSNYPSVYEQKKETHSSSTIASKALNVLKNSDVFRTYDAVPLLVSTVTMQRIHDILSQTTGKPEYISLLNIQDDCNIAAALGCVVAVKRHPMNTPRLYEGRDYHLQIAGDRHVDKRLNEMDRFVRWQRLAAPMAAGYGTYKASENFLTDKIRFRVGDTWKKDTWGKMVTQGAPAIMARNMPLPKVEIDKDPPYVLASQFPNGAIAIATEGRVKPENSWYFPRANITVDCGKSEGHPIGIFGHYQSLTLTFAKNLPKKIVVLAQDLLSDKAIDITKNIKIENNSVVIPGNLIDEIGTLANANGDISAPGLVLQLK